MTDKEKVSKKKKFRYSKDGTPYDDGNWLTSKEKQDRKELVEQANTEISGIMSELLDVNLEDLDFVSEENQRKVIESNFELAKQYGQFNKSQKEVLKLVMDNPIRFLGAYKELSRATDRNP